MGTRAKLGPINLIAEYRMGFERFVFNYLIKRSVKKSEIKQSLISKLNSSHPGFKNNINTVPMMRSLF